VDDDLAARGWLSRAIFRYFYVIKLRRWTRGHMVLWPGWLERLVFGNVQVSIIFGLFCKNKLK
jgi:hypothetical protein